MAQQFGGKPSHVPGIVLFLTLWILSLAFVAPVFVGFRRTGDLELAGSPLEGNLPPYLEYRWGVSLDEARTGHGELHARADDVVEAFRSLARPS